jgi:hypothetical protein
MMALLGKNDGVLHRWFRLSRHLDADSSERYSRCQ